MRALSLEQKTEIANLFRSGLTFLQIAKKLSVSESSVARVLRESRSRGEVFPLRRGRPPKKPKFKIEPVAASVVIAMCAEHHVYRSAGQVATYAFAVVEDDRPVAVFSWQPPPLGAAKKVCPEAPEAVLALSRMVAVPREQRHLRHISKPLRYQMQKLIDRTRWPVLITFSDEGLGHTGHVYKCSGWQPTDRAKRTFYVDSSGKRVSIPTSDKKRDVRDLTLGGTTTLQRWEHWICGRGDAAQWMRRHGWRRVPKPGRTWRSGNPVWTWVRERK